jgi:hypothetical protein
MATSFRFYLRAFDVNEAELKEHGDRFVLARLSEKISASKYVDQAVVLAMDGVITTGELDYEQTQIDIPNEYVVAELATFDNLIFWSEY